LLGLYWTFSFWWGNRCACYIVEMAHYWWNVFGLAAEHTESSAKAHAVS
jgi:hypothetical protein